MYTACILELGEISGRNATMDPVVSGLTLFLVIVVAIAAFVIGRRGSNSSHDRDLEAQRRLEEYDFYPFLVNTEGHVEFSSDAFNNAVDHLLEKRNERAARELIVIGEQNLVRDTFPSDRLNNYKRLYAEYHGDDVINDNDVFLENYKRIVNQLGRSFPGTGIEILLHNLVNPSRSLVAIENGVVTGRSIGSGATNLVLDLKTRRQRGEDKVNYELNIGSRQFKCTTIPIFRPDYGLVGAVCINVDTHFIREAATNNDQRLDAFVDNLLRTDFELDENILSKDEYHNALNGKRHYLDEAIRTRGARTQERKLAAILFSDIVGFTALMGDNETATLQIMSANEEIHNKSFATNGGRLLKKLGDGMLASFDSVSGAVASAKAIQEAVKNDGRFELRIGIHLGEVIHDQDDVHGDGVNIASRIQTEVGAGQIGISKVVHDNIKNKEGMTATLIGERSLKNVSAPVTLYTLDV
jgi:class 3 adenylate cyclase